MTDSEPDASQNAKPKFESDLYIDDPDHPDNQFYTPAEKRAQYYESLGRFVTEFAEAEALLRYVCAKASEVPSEMAGLIFGDVGVASGGQLLKRLRDVRGLDPDGNLTDSLRQFGFIAETRNAILHRGVEFGEQVFLTKPGLPNNRCRQYEVSAAVLDAMLVDLLWIRVTLIMALPNDNPLLMAWGQEAKKPERVPWQYTHAP